MQSFFPGYPAAARGVAEIITFGAPTGAAVIMVAVVVLARRRQWPEATYLGLTLIALTTSSTFASLARNSVTLFPLTILIAVTVTHPPHRAMKPVILAAWWTLFAVNTALFAFGYWAD